MVAFFTGFYKKYPQYANNPLYMACESYGGHYCPSATYALFESNKNAGTNFPIKGMAIGNGLVDPASQYPTYPKFVEDQCTKEIGKPCVDKSGYESMVAASPTCSKLIAQCQSDDSACPTAQSYCNNAMFGPYEATYMNPYGELGPRRSRCLRPGPLRPAGRRARFGLCPRPRPRMLCHLPPPPARFHALADIRIPCEVPPLCYDFSGVATFLNNPATQKAIGVNGITWASCNYEVNGDFSADWMKNMAWKVPPLLKAGIPAWVYAGEDDFIVQWLGNQAWTEALPWPGAKAYNQTTLQPWTSGGKVAGAHRSYGGLSFTTVANAGHMAPRDQPEATLTMINAFISGQPLPSE